MMKNTCKISIYNCSDRCDLSFCTVANEQYSTWFTTYFRDNMKRQGLRWSGSSKVGQRKERIAELDDCPAVERTRVLLKGGVTTKAYVPRNYSSQRLASLQAASRPLERSTIMRRGQEPSDYATEEYNDLVRKKGEVLPPVVFNVISEKQPHKKRSTTGTYKQKSRSNKPQGVYITHETVISANLPSGVERVNNQVFMATNYRFPQPTRPRKRTNRTQSEQAWRPFISVRRNNTIILPTSTAHEEDLENTSSGSLKTNQPIPLPGSNQTVPSPLLPGANFLTEDAGNHYYLPTLEGMQTPRNSPDWEERQAKEWKDTVQQGGNTNTCKRLSRALASPREPDNSRRPLALNHVLIGDEAMLYMVQPRRSAKYNAPPSVISRKLPSSSGSSRTPSKLEPKWKQSNFAFNRYTPPTARSKDWQVPHRRSEGSTSASSRNTLDQISSSAHTHEETLVTAFEREESRKTFCVTTKVTKDSVSPEAETHHADSESHSQKMDATGNNQLAEINGLFKGFYLKDTPKSERSSTQGLTACDRYQAKGGNEDGGFSTLPGGKHQQEKCCGTKEGSSSISVESGTSTPCLKELSPGFTPRHSASSSLSSLFSRAEYDDIGSLPSSPFCRRSMFNRRSSSIDSAMSRPSSDLLDVPFYVTPAKDRLPGLGDSPADSPQSISYFFAERRPPAPGGAPCQQPDPRASDSLSQSGGEGMSCGPCTYGWIWWAASFTPSQANGEPRGLSTCCQPHYRRWWWFQCVVW